MSIKRIEVTDLTPFRYIVQVRVERTVLPTNFIGRPNYWGIRDWDAYNNEIEQRALDGAWED